MIQLTLKGAKLAPIPLQAAMGPVGTKYLMERAGRDKNFAFDFSGRAGRDFIFSGRDKNYSFELMQQFSGRIGNLDLNFPKI
jgi:hypothetical protein